MHGYRMVFKGGNTPFEATEIEYWRDLVVSSLRLLEESGDDIVVARKSPDWQQQDSSETNTGESGENSVPLPEFATLVAGTCVVPHLHRIAHYLAERRQYYQQGAGTATIDGQVVDLANVIGNALVVIKNEITRNQTTKQLTAPEFRAVLPHYIKYLSDSFDGLARLVRPDTTTEDSLKAKRSLRREYRSRWPGFPTL